MFTLIVLYFMHDQVKYVTDNPQTILDQLNLKAVSLVTIERNH